MIICFDLETTVNGGPDGDSPEAHWDANRVLLCGWTLDGGDVETSDNVGSLLAEIEQAQSEYETVTLVAHNLKFDLKYLMREDSIVRWEDVIVWDTMTWEYLNSGHRITMASLEDTAARHGVTFAKSLDLGALLSSGIKMEDIPTEELRDYLIEDVRVLHRIYEAQLAKGVWWMQHLLPLAEMELNGLPLDIPAAEAMAVEMQGEINDSFDFIRDYIIDNCVWQDGSPVELDDFSDLVTPKSKCLKPTANRTISFLFTGAPEELKVTPKWRLSLKGQPIMNDDDIVYIYEDIEPSHVGYPVDEGTIDKIDTRLGGSIDLLYHLIRHRKATKVVNTYLLPMIAQAKIQGTVHPKLNTAITATGRLSSSQPNGQNMPPEVRSLIRASHEGRVLEEVDYSQLETVCAATLSRCPALIKALASGEDIHERTATRVFGKAQAEAKRKLAKNVNFGVLYGGKAHGLSKQTGVDKATIQELIDAFFDSYPGVAEWQREFFEDVVDNMEAHDVKDGEQRYRSDYVLPASGRKFRFIETEAPGWLRRKTHRKFSFSPNHTANYPIQGFAGGDLVMHGLYELWKNVRALPNDTKIQFRLTVHDSMLLERPKEWDLSGLYRSMCGHLNTRFKLPVNIEVDVEAGFNWR